MKEGKGVKQKFYIVFSKSTEPPWYSRYLDKHFKHVHILKYDIMMEVWIIVDMSGGNISLDVFPKCSIRKIYPTEVILEAWSKLQEKPQLTIIPTTCVELVKLTLGIRKPSIVTPFQLYKFLSKGTK